MTTQDTYERRIQQLNIQNANFRRLLQLTGELSIRKTLGLTRLRDEAHFIKQTLLFLENEKEKIKCEKEPVVDPNSKNFLQTLINKIPQGDIAKKIQKLEADNIDMRKKLIVLLEKNKMDSSSMDELRKDHETLKKLLFDSTNLNFVGILQVPGEFIRVPRLLHIDVAKQKIKNYILGRLATKTEEVKKEVKLNEATQCETDSESLYASDSRSEFRELQYELAHLKKQVEGDYHKSLASSIESDVPEASLILELEQERTGLLNQLQMVLEESTKQIADEYCKLQDKISMLEREKNQLQEEVDSVLSKNEVLIGTTESSEFSDKKLTLEESLRNLMDKSKDKLDTQSSYTMHNSPVGDNIRNTAGDNKMGINYQQKSFEGVSKKSGNQCSIM